MDVRFRQVYCTMYYNLNKSGMIKKSKRQNFQGELKVLQEKKTDYV